MGSAKDRSESIESAALTHEVANTISKHLPNLTITHLNVGHIKATRKGEEMISGFLTIYCPLEKRVVHS